LFAVQAQKNTDSDRTQLAETLKILIISQVFWPDTSSVSQHLSDLAEELAYKKHDVVVLTSRNAYEDPTIRFKKKETFKGITIERIWQTRFGKSTKVGRLLDFISFNVMLFFRLLFLKRKQYHVIVGLTVPPLISFLGVITAKIKGAKFCYWTMDLQPELAIVSGYLREGSIAARILLFMGNVIFRKADRILTLDRFMAEYIVKRGADREKITVSPVWPVMNEVFTGARRDNPFRREYGFGEKIVIMYSGNHAVVHPLDTLLKAAVTLKDDDRFIFVFVGGGVRKKEVTAIKIAHHLGNIVQLPYQDRDKMHFSMGAADIHVVVQGNGCTGFTHPNKIYGAMFIGRPIVYIGPVPSHITDILEECPGNISVEHGHDRLLVEKLYEFAQRTDAEKENIGRRNIEYARQHCSKSTLIDALIVEIEKSAND
jgi:hypothetical protein